MTTYVPASSVTYSNTTFQNNQNIISVDLKNTPFKGTLTRAFYQCTNLANLTNVNFDNKTSLISTFGFCRNLVDAPTIPNSITDMQSSFSGCTNLVNVPEIPNSVTNLYRTFYNCCNLTNAPVIPNSVLDASGFIAYCPQLFDENIYSDIPQSVQKLDDMYAGMNYTATDVPQWCLDKWNNCSTNVKNSMSGMFKDWYCLINAPTIPDGVKDISQLFMGCRSLINNIPNLPNTITNMQHTFATCINLTTAPEIPNSVTSMLGTFQSCRNLITAPNIPESVTNMTVTFSNCVNLTGDIYIKAKNISSIGTPGDVLDLIFANTSLQKNVYIPFNYSNGVNTITYNTFINAGYDEIGTQDGVYLKDINANTGPHVH